jgi:hypothetical protein
MQDMKPADISRIKRGNIRKTKLMRLQQTVKKRNFRDMYRGINQFKRGYQPRSNLAKDENGDLLADSRILLFTT